MFGLECIYLAFNCTVVYLNKQHHHLYNPALLLRCVDILYLPCTNDSLVYGCNSCSGPFNVNVDITS